MNDNMEITLSEAGMRKIIFEIRKNNLRDSTKEFIDSFEKQLDENFMPTEKQVKTLLRIAREWRRWNNEKKFTFEEDLAGKINRGKKDEEYR